MAVHCDTAATVREALLARGEPVPLAFALTIVWAAAKALESVHARGDVSLANVAIDGDGSVRLAGVSTAKPAAAPADRHADVRALGKMLCQLTAMLGGEYPRSLGLVAAKALGLDFEQRFRAPAALRCEVEAVAGELGVPLGRASVAAVMDRLRAC